MKAEATIKMPRITDRHADMRLLARTVKCLSVVPDFNREMVKGIEEVLKENITPVARSQLRNLLTYIKLVPHIWETDPWRAWTLLKDMYEDGRISSEELDTIVMCFSAGVDVHEELEKAMEHAEQGKVNEDELLTVSDELKALADWQKQAEFHNKRGAALNTSHE